MHAADGHRTRYEVCYRLVHGGAMSPKELETAMTIDDSTLHYHLNKLVDVDLIEKRQRTERGQEVSPPITGRPYSARLRSPKGVNELIRGEQAFDSMYNSAIEAEDSER